MVSAGNIAIEDGVSVLKRPNIEDDDWKDDDVVEEVGEELLEGTRAVKNTHDDDREIQKVQSDNFATEHSETNTKLIEQYYIITDDDDARESNRFGERDQLNTDVFLHVPSTNKNDEKNVKTNRGIWERLSTDPKFRAKMFRTVVLWWSMFVSGWRSSLTGPAFPDLRQIINKDLTTASWILTALSGGGLVGAAAGGALYDRYNGPGLFVTIGVGVAVTTGIIPWCNHFLAMVSVHVACGAFSFALDLAANTDTLRLWHENPGPAVQFVFFGFSVGAILSPIVSEPFLSKPLSSAAHNRSLGVPSGERSLPTTVWIYGISANKTIGNAMDDMLGNAINTSLDQTISINSDLGSLNNSVLNDDQPIYGETNIYIAYVISAVLALTVVLLFTLEHFITGSIHLDKTPAVCKEKDIVDKAVKEYNLSAAYKVAFTMLISIMMMLYIIIERTYVSFLMTFVISRLHWSKTGGSTATSIFWLTLATGRLFGVYTLKRFKLRIVIISNIVIILVGISLFWLSTVLGNTALCWVSVALVGLGMSVVCGSAITWLSENVVHVQGKISSVLWVVSSVGAMIFPLLTGYLMNEVSYDWFIYLLMILAVTMLAIFLFVEILHKNAK